MKEILSIKVHRWLSLLAAAYVTVSCTSGKQDEGGPVSDSGGLFFKVCSGEDIGMMEPGAAVGVFLASSVNGEVFYKNELMLADKDGMAVSGNERFILEPYGDCDFFAYSPYDSSWDDVPGSVVEFEVSADQRSAMDYKASDLMLSHGIEFRNGLNEAVFHHVMAEVILHITDRTGLFDMSGSRAVLHDMQSASYVYVEDGTCQAAGTSVSDIACHMLDSRDRRASLAVVLPPQDPEGAMLTFSISIGDAEYDFELSDVPALESGKVYVFSLRMTDRGLELEDSTISDWEDDGGGSLNVAFE